MIITDGQYQSNTDCQCRLLKQLPTWPKCSPLRNRLPQKPSVGIRLGSEGHTGKANLAATTFQPVVWPVYTQPWPCRPFKAPTYKWQEFCNKEKLLVARNPWYPLRTEVSWPYTIKKPSRISSRQSAESLRKPMSISWCHASRSTIHRMDKRFLQALQGTLILMWLNHRGGLLKPDTGSPILSLKLVV
jgi:hypothetical protein